DVSRMRGGKCARDLNRAGDGFGERKPGRRNPRGQRIPGNVFHQQVVKTVGFGDVVYRDNVWMIQSRSCAGFALESARALIENLDRNSSAKARVASLVNFAHATFAEQSKNLIRSECRAGCQT